MIKKSQFLTFALLFALIATTLTAKVDSFKPISFIKDTLPNGLNVIYTIDKDAPIIATVVQYRVGSRYEKPGKTGYTHFFEHLMFEATKSYERAAIDKFVEEAGGNLNAHTSFDETVYYLQLPSNYLEMALWIESSRMRGLKVDTIGVQTQKGVVTEELITRRENSAYGTLLDKISEHLFKGTNYEWTTLGSLDDIKNAKIEDFKEFYDGYYYPNNATLAISGDFDLAEARKLVNKYFVDMPRHQIPAERPFVIQPLEKEIRETIEDAKAQMPGIFVGYPGVSMFDPDFYALDILADILAAGESSRFYQKLVDNEKISLQAGFFPFALEKGGSLVFYSIVAPGKDNEENIKAMDEIVSDIIKNGVKPEELQKSKNIKEASFVGDKKGTLSKAESLARYNAYYGSPDRINTEIENYMSVTMDDIKRVAKKYFGTDKRLILIYTPKEKI